MVQQQQHDAKSEAEVSIQGGSTSQYSPVYFVQSPPHNHHQDDFLLCYSTDDPSPTHHHYHCSPIHHHSRHSSRYSAASSDHKFPPFKYNQLSLQPHNVTSTIINSQTHHSQLRFYLLCFLFAFAILFASSSLILWGSSFSYKPNILLKSIVFENFNVQAGMDLTGVPTDMLTLNSTVRIFYRNPATFFGVHVTSTPLLLRYFDLKLASGHMTKFYQSRKSQRLVLVQVQGHQVPLYGGIPLVTVAKGHPESMSVPLNLTFVMRSRAYMLGKLVSPKFYRTISCQVTLRGNHLGKSLNLTKMHSCVYR